MRLLFEAGVPQGPAADEDRELIARVEHRLTLKLAKATGLPPIIQPNTSMCQLH